jgi:hypothetical protein
MAVIKLLRFYGILCNIYLNTNRQRLRLVRETNAISWLDAALSKLSSLNEDDNSIEEEIRSYL